MKYVLVILVIAIIIIFIEVPSLLERKLKRELKAFFIILFFAVILSSAKALNMNIPNPSEWLTKLYNPINNFIYAIFK